eukprot:3461271-Pyramimonas_sp.AAC.1
MATIHAGRMQSDCKALAKPPFKYKSIGPWNMDANRKALVCFGALWRSTASFPAKSGMFTFCKLQVHVAS